MGSDSEKGQALYSGKDENMIRLMGCILLMAGCGGFGFSQGAAHRREIAMLRQMIRGLQQMQWELKYRNTELPELCRICGDMAGGKLKGIFQELGERLDRREVWDISGCLNGMIQGRSLPRRVRKNLKQLGACLGRFDLEGQLQGLEAVDQQCRRDLRELEENKSQRIRSYQTLALCAGVALAILLV